MNAMIIILAILAFVGPAMFAVSACMLSSRITQILEQLTPATGMEKR